VGFSIRFAAAFGGGDFGFSIGNASMARFVQLLLAYIGF
jgi:hypothetical protein